MASWTDLIQTHGINTNIVLAGRGGGLLRALSRKEYKIREVFVSPLCGLLAAINLTAFATYAVTKAAAAVGWGMPDDAISTERAVAFLIGLSAMWLSDMVFDFVAAKLKNVP